MALVDVALHPSGLPHAEALGLPIWAQWLAVGVVVLIGIWLVLDGRESAADRTAAPPAGAPARSDSAEPEPAEALVAGRSPPPAPADKPDRVLPRAPSLPSSPRAMGGQTAPGVVWPTAIQRVDIAPGAVRALAIGAGRAVYVAVGASDVQSESGELRVHRASVPHLDGATRLTALAPGLMVRLGAGDLLLAASRARVLAGNATDRPAVLIVMGSTSTPSGWLNPIRVLTLLLGLGAGALALDRARAVEALASFIGTGGVLNASRVGFFFAALLLIGAAFAPMSPRLAALIFLIAAGVGAFLATAGRWENRLEWWGAEYVLTAWTNMPIWAAGAAGLALLSLAGWRYRTRGAFPRVSIPRHRRTRRSATGVGRQA